jgi:hypothetical protein
MLSISHDALKERDDVKYRWLDYVNLHDAKGGGSQGLDGAATPFGCRGY